MKLEKWALVAEILGGVAILVTLIVLVYETRENNELERVSAYQAVTQDFDDWRTLILTDPELLELIANLFGGNAPEPGEDPVTDLRFQFLSENQWSGNERAFIAYRADIIDERDWSRINRAICAEYSQTPDYLWEQIAFRLSDDFLGFLDSDCAQ